SSTFSRTEPRCTRHLAALPPFRNPRAASVALPLCCRLHSDFGHDGEIVLALTVTALAVGRAASHAFTVELLTTVGAVSEEAVPPHFHRATVAPAVDDLRLSPILMQSRIASVVPILTAKRTHIAVKFDMPAAAAERAVTRPTHHDISVGLTLGA